PLRPEQLEQRLECREIPFPSAGEEARRPEVAGESGLLLESPEEHEALLRESDADSCLVVLTDEGTAVARGPGGDVTLLEQDDPKAPPREVPRDARPHAAATDDDRIGRAWHSGCRHGVPNRVQPYRAFSAAFLFPSRHKYHPRMTILYLRGLPMRGRAGHVEARRRRRTGPGRHRGLRRCRLQRPAPRRGTAQRDSPRDERHRPPVPGRGLDPP